MPLADRVGQPDLPRTSRTGRDCPKWQANSMRSGKATRARRTL
jgi:hypothetical protein